MTWGIAADKKAEIQMWWNSEIKFSKNICKNRMNGGGLERRAERWHSSMINTSRAIGSVQISELSNQNDRPSKAEGLKPYEGETNDMVYGLLDVESLCFSTPEVVHLAPNAVQIISSCFLVFFLCSMQALTEFWKQILGLCFWHLQWVSCQHTHYLMVLSFF